MVEGGTLRVFSFFFPSWISSWSFFLLRRIAMAYPRLQTFAITTLVLLNLCIAWKSCFSTGTLVTSRTFSMVASRYSPLRFSGNVHTFLCGVLLLLSQPSFNLCYSWFKVISGTGTHSSAPYFIKFIFYFWWWKTLWIDTLNLNEQKFCCSIFLLK